jgi:hypothetical protein
LHLIPKTMKWKARVKRMFFGPLKQLPATLGPTLPAVQPMVAINPNEPQPGYKVIYAIGRRRTVEQQVAA